MKILLISPPQKNIYGKGVDSPYPPLGLLSIAAVLKEKKHEIKFVDMSAENIDIDQLIQIVKKFGPDLIGFTAVTPTFEAALEIIKKVKKDFDVKIVLGGIHATIMKDKIMVHNEIDFSVIGEGEITILELVNALISGNNNFSDIKGLYSRRGKDVLWGGVRELIKNLDELPFPAMDLINDINKYTPPNITRSPVLPIMTSRGCPFSCSFCCSEQLFGHFFRARTVESIISEIDFYIKKYNVREIHILDDLFLVNKKRVLDFCEKVLENKYDISFSFANGVRVDMIDDDILSNLKKIGLRNIGFGIESGNQKVLDRVNKRLTLEQIRKGVKLCKKYNFETWGFFIIGLPGDTEETVRETIDFAIELDPDYAKFLILKPYPGSKVYYELSEQNYILSHDYSDYGTYAKPVHRIDDLSPERMLYLQKLAFFKFYMRPKKIWKQLTKIKTLTGLKSFLSMFRFFLNRFIKI